MKVVVNIKKVHFYAIAGLLVLFGGMFAVNAFGGVAPSIMGHSVGEIDFSGGFNVPSGNVGVGVASPTQKLDVNGNVRISGNVLASTYCDINGANCKTASQMGSSSGSGVSVGKGRSVKWLPFRGMSTNCVISRGLETSYFWGKVDSDGNVFYRMYHVRRGSPGHDTGWVAYNGNKLILRINLVPSYFSAATLSLSIDTTGIRGFEESPANSYSGTCTGLWPWK